MGSAKFHQLTWKGKSMAILYVGIDLAKNVFAVHGVNEAGKPVLVRPSVARAKLHELIASLPPCVVGIEACSGAHHWARLFMQHGHTVRLMAPKFVVPYRLSGKRGKNDACDAAAICEAVQRPHMRFVPVKTEAQQAHPRDHELASGRASKFAGEACEGRRSAQSGCRCDQEANETVALREVRAPSADVSIFLGSQPGRLSALEAQAEISSELPRFPGCDVSTTPLTHRRSDLRNVGTDVGRKQKRGARPRVCLIVGGVDGTRTRDPRRDRPVF